MHGNGNRTWPQDSDGNDIAELNLLEEFAVARGGEGWTRVGGTDRTGGECRAVAWSADGAWFGWSCGHKTIRIVQWNRPANHSVTNEDAQGNCLDYTTEINTGDLVWAMAFGTKRSVNTTKMTTSGRMWGGNVVTNGQSSICSKEFSVGETVVATGQSNGRIRIWNILTGQLKFELCDHTAQIESLHFAPVGRFLLVSVAADGTLKLWDMDDCGNMFRTLKCARGSFHDCRWAPDAKTLATVGDLKSAHLWDMRTYELIRKLDSHHHKVCRCDYSPDGAILATCSFDTRVILWDSYTGAQLLELKFQILGLKELNILTGAQLLELNHMNPPPSLMYAGGANGTYVRGVSFSTNGINICTVCDDGFLRVWDITSPDSPAMVSAVRNGLSVQYAPSGSAIAVGNAKGCVSIWQAPEATPSLQHLCRLTIRRCVTNSSHLDKLSDFVPPSLRRYLAYSPNYWIFIE